MILTDAPETKYSYKRNLHADGALAFIEQLQALDAETLVGYLSGRLEATRGAWARIGSYRLANGSFIDPSDLMLYVASYYVPDDAGAIEAVELNHGPAPDDALTFETLDELLDVLAQLDYCEVPVGEGGDETEQDGEAGADDAVAAAGEASTARLNGEPAAAPSKLDGLTALEPSGTTEMHGALVKDWHAMYYEAIDGSSLLVLD